MDKKLFDHILKACIGIIFLVFVLFRFTEFKSAILTIFSIITPFLIGTIIALYSNVLLNTFEKLLDRYIFKDRVSMGIKRGISLSLTILFLILVFIFALYIVIPSIRETFVMVSASIPQASLELEALIDKYDLEIADEWIDSFNATLGDFLIMIGDNIDQILLGSISFLTSTISFVVNFVLAVVFSLYILLSKERLSRQFKKILYAFLPRESAEVAILSGQRFTRIFHNSTIGSLKEAMIFIVLNTILMAALGLPYIFTVGVIVFFLTFIPYFGAFFAGLFGSLLVATSGLRNGIVYLVIYIILQQIEGNVINPRVVGSEVGLPGIWVMASVTIFGSIFGILGMLLAVPITALVYFTIKDVVDYRLKTQKGENVKLSEVIKSSEK